MRRREPTVDTSRFEQLTSAFAARRVSRRAALAAGGAGAAGLTAAALGAAGRPAALAREATPGATAAAGEGGPAFLFVQLFEQGTWTPKPGEDGLPADPGRRGRPDPLLLRPPRPHRRHRRDPALPRRPRLHPRQPPERRPGGADAGGGARRAGDRAVRPGLYRAV